MSASLEGPPSAATTPPGSGHGLAVAGLTLVAFALHASGQWFRPLWLDEACTWWTVQASPLDLLGGERTDGTPPLYFLLVWATTRIFGEAEWALRLPSLALAVALVPGLFWVGRRFVGERAALLAAGLAVVSPLVHYYAVEARNYALLQALVLPLLLAFSHAMAAPDRWPRWGGVTLALLALLYTHNWGVFLLPAPAFAVLCMGGSPRIALAALGASVAAFLGYLPWLGIALEPASQGISDWILPWWDRTSFVLLRSLESFGVGGHYPPYLSYLGAAPSLRWASIPLTAACLGLAAWASRRSEPAPQRALWAFLLVPLGSAFLFSLVRPLYLVGRYDTIALPAFLLLAGAGLGVLLERSRVATAVCCVGIVGLAGVSMGPSFGEAWVTEPRNTGAAEVLRARLSETDALVTTGLRRAVVEYELTRALGPDPVPIHSFPAEIASHPGWYSAPRLAADPTLSTQAVSLAQTLRGVAEAGGTVWLLVSEFEAIDRQLREALQRAGLGVDLAESDEALGLYALKVGPTS